MREYRRDEGYMAVKVTSSSIITCTAVRWCCPRKVGVDVVVIVVAVVFVGDCSGDSSTEVKKEVVGEGYMGGEGGGGGQSGGAGERLVLTALLLLSLLLVVVVMLAEEEKEVVKEFLPEEGYMADKVVLS